MKKRTRVVIAGGTGFIGQVLAKHAEENFHEVIILTRHARPGRGRIRYVEWDGEQTGNWMQYVDGCDLLVNLSGRSVNCRYTEHNRQQILESRLRSTMILGAAVIMANHPPSLWINSSTATIYRDTRDFPNDEFSQRTGDDFSMNVAKQWEDTFNDIPTPGTRKISLRTSIVLGREGGALPVMRQLASLGLGGRQGDGKQMVSWIHEHDFCRIIDFCFRNTELEGPVIASSPNAVTNEVFTRVLRHYARAPFHFPQPGWMLSLGALLMRTQPELVLKSRWVVPSRLLSQGFDFIYPSIDMAIKNICHESTSQAHSQPALVPAF